MRAATRTARNRSCIPCSRAPVRWPRCVTHSRFPLRVSARGTPRLPITRRTRTSPSPITSITSARLDDSCIRLPAARWLELPRAAQPHRPPGLPDLQCRVQRHRYRSGPNADRRPVRDHHRHRRTCGRGVRRPRHPRGSADRAVFGSARKRFLVAGSLIMGTFTLLSAFATSFAVLVATRIVAGIGASVIFPNVTATVGDNFTYRERGNVMGTVIGLNTMAGVIGVPLAGIIAEATSWRVAIGMVGTLSILASLLLLWKLHPAQIALNESRIAEMYRSIVTNRSALGAIGSSFLGALYWFTWATYIVVFFERAFGLSQGVASTFALTQGLGVLLGSQLGARLGTRIGHRPVVAGSVLLSGVLLLLQTNLTPPLLATALLNVALSAVIGARFASNTTLLTEQVPEARGTLLALSASVTSASIVAGATIGGLIIH